MPVLKIRNFGPIESFDFNIRRFNILIGRQASGKSTVAKLLYFFRTMPHSVSNIIRKKPQGNPYELFIKELRRQFINLFGPVYHQANLNIEYSFVIDSKKQSIKIIQNHKNGNNYISFKFCKVLKEKIDNLFERYLKIKSNAVRDNYGLLDTIENEENEAQFVNNCLNEARLVFCCTQNPLFVPAARTQLTLFQESLLRIHEIEEDVITKNFILAMREIRKLCGGGLEQAEEQILRTSEKQPVRTSTKLARDLIKKILRGSYKSINGEERIYHSKEGHTKLSVASSGQQESLWILLAAYSLILKKEDCFTIFEEPEAHLFPEAQDYISRLLVLLLNTSKNNYVTLTTHSPYILTSINNLLAAHEAKMKEKNKIYDIIDKQLFLDKQELSAYLLGDKVEDIYNKDLNIVDSEKIDTVSARLNNEYDKIIDLGVL